MSTQPHYPDGTKAWAVDAIRPGGNQRRITTTYVRAAGSEDARQAGKHRLRSLVKACGHQGGWRCTVRAADAVAYQQPAAPPLQTHGPALDPLPAVAAGPLVAAPF